MRFFFFFCIPANFSMDAFHGFVLTLADAFHDVRSGLALRSFDVRYFFAANVIG